MYMCICIYVYISANLCSHSNVKEKKQKKQQINYHIDGRFSVQYLVGFWEFKLATIND